MKQNAQLTNTLQAIEKGQLREALTGMENYLLANPGTRGMTELSAIREDYQLMADYWKRGFDDAQRPMIYRRLLQRMYVLAANAQLDWQMQDSSFMSSLRNRVRRARPDWSLEGLRRAMETFVSDTTMLQLEPENKRQQKSEQLHKEHWDFMVDSFDYILTSQVWHESLAGEFIDMLLSPTLYTHDQQLIISAITLSAVQHFCFQRFRVLTEVYRRTTDEHLRQCALVGWVLALGNNKPMIYPEVGEIVAGLCDDERTRSELAELQMQLVYCLDADADTQTIQQEIIPEIMKGSNIKFDGRDLIETEEDKLEDILHPEDSEQDVEHMEQSMKRMIDMQKQGADIYFGGFAQMKRFPFFNTVASWFVPFYSQHPAISQIWNNARGKNLLKAITRTGAFCDSDKYSFVLAFSQVLGHLPQSILKLAEEGDALPMPLGGEVSAEEQRQPAFLRRACLQNLYRFFRLFSARDAFQNPFNLPDKYFNKEDMRRIFFFSNSLLGCEPMRDQYPVVARFLMKHHRYSEAVYVLCVMPGLKDDVQACLMMATALTRAAHYPMTLLPVDFLIRALELAPDNERARASLARHEFSSNRYKNAWREYDALSKDYPDNRSYRLNAAVCLVHLRRIDEALPILYEFNYLDADDMAVVRVLAWALTVGSQYEQAEKHYLRLLQADKPLPADLLNYGYSLWISHQTEAAIGMFRRFLDEQDKGYDMKKEFMLNEHELLSSHGISDTEIQLMLDAVLY